MAEHPAASTAGGRTITQGRLPPDGYTVAVEHLAEACEHAVQIIRSPQNLRSFLQHVCDDLGEGLFVASLAFVFGRPH
jgi:hypothetical protein